MNSSSHLPGLPKVEIHLHLDCSLSIDSVSALVPGMTLERYRDEYLAPAKCRNLVDYFRYLEAPQALLQNAEALKIATADLMRQLHEDNVVYAEIRFAPHLHLQGGLTPEQVVEAVLEGRREGWKHHPVETRLILCTLRHYDTATGMKVLELAGTYRTEGVGGIDLAGDEAGFSLDPHVPVFTAAAERGIPATAHAGEASGADSVREVVERLGVRRVGHGVRSIEDEAVVNLLIEREVHLETCPSCNIQIDVFDRYQDHPIDRLAMRGVSVGVNTDARGPTALTLALEYSRLHGVFGWDEAAFRRANQRALSAAFLDEPTRKRLAERLDG